MNKRPGLFLLQPVSSGAVHAMKVALLTYETFVETRRPGFQGPVSAAFHREAMRAAA